MDDDEFEVTDLTGYLTEQRAVVERLASVSFLPFEETMPRDIVIDFIDRRVWWAPWRRKVRRFKYTACRTIVGPDGAVSIAPTEQTESSEEVTTVTEWPWRQAQENRK